MLTDMRVIVGAGGHARVVMDALLCIGNTKNSYVFVDDDVKLHGVGMLGVDVLGPSTQLIQRGTLFHVAVGNNRTREMLFSRFVSIGGLPFAVTHPAACVSQFANVSQGSFVAAGAVVAPASVIGVGVIINHSAVVDHDCRVGDFSHVAPGATLAGGVVLGRGVLVGAGAHILPGITIGVEAVIGAGAVVTADVPPHVKVVGVPGRIV
jgi:sugar O-acyltransferase (sialic acid O-acetyltransferase NeuD family)